jgi:hypothetical protein
LVVLQMGLIYLALKIRIHHSKHNKPLSLDLQALLELHKLINFRQLHNHKLSIQVGLNSRISCSNNQVLILVVKLTILNSDLLQLHLLVSNNSRRQHFSQIPQRQLLHFSLIKALDSILLVRLLHS